MPHSADKTTRTIVGRSLIAATALARELRDNIGEFFRRWFRRLRTRTLVDQLTATIARPMAVVREHIHYTNMIGWISGYDWAWKKIPDWFQPQVPKRPRSPLILPPDIERPPPEVPPGWFDNTMFDMPEEIRFINIEEAAQRLLERDALTREEFDEASELLREDAFTIAGNIEADVIEIVRDRLGENIQQGTSLDGFIESLDQDLLSSFLGDAHIETVYRTGVQGAFRDGRETIMSNPIVAELFPYQEYIHVNDTRVRDEHKSLSTLGLSGTGVYRRDDPFWDLFTPPWGFNCRCTVVPLTIDAAAREGVREAKEWLRTGRPPANPEWRIEHIPFEPKPGWGSRGRVGVMA